MQASVWGMRSQLWLRCPDLRTTSLQGVRSSDLRQLCSSKLRLRRPEVRPLPQGVLCSGAGLRHL
jgi:hypothetical protein